MHGGGGEGCNYVWHGVFKKQHRVLFSFLLSGLDKGLKRWYPGIDTQEKLRFSWSGYFALVKQHFREVVKWLFFGFWLIILASIIALIFGNNYVSLILIALTLLGLFSSLMTFGGSFWVSFFKNWDSLLHISPPLPTLHRLRQKPPLLHPPALAPPPPACPQGPAAPPLGAFSERNGSARKEQPGRVAAPPLHYRAGVSDGNRRGHLAFSAPDYTGVVCGAG